MLQLPLFAWVLDLELGTLCAFCLPQEAVGWGGCTSTLPAQAFTPMFSAARFSWSPTIKLIPVHLSIYVVYCFLPISYCSVFHPIGCKLVKTKSQSLSLLRAQHLTHLMVQIGVQQLFTEWKNALTGNWFIFDELLSLRLIVRERYLRIHLLYSVFYVSSIVHPPCFISAPSLIHLLTASQTMADSW